jgi:hypothetical protein
MLNGTAGLRYDGIDEEVCGVPKWLSLMPW